MQKSRRPVAAAIATIPGATAQARTHSCAAKHSKTMRTFGTARIISRQKSNPFNKRSKYKAAYACSSAGSAATDPTVYVIEKHELGKTLCSEKITLLDHVAITQDLRTLKLTGDLLTWTSAGVSKRDHIK